MVWKTIAALVLVAPLMAQAAGVPLLDPAGGSHGTAAVTLSKGSVRMKITGLPQLPAANPLGATFTAYVYKGFSNADRD